MTAPDDMAVRAALFLAAVLLLGVLVRALGRRYGGNDDSR